MPQGARKLWQSDYRPGRPGGQPGLRIRKRFPILRLLLLGGIAGFLFYRFDHLLPKALFWRPLEGSQVVTEISARLWTFNQDSSTASLKCGPDIQTCARAGEEFGANLVSEIEWLYAKAVWRHELKNPRATGITLALRDSGNSRIADLMSLEGEEDNIAFRYHRTSSDQNYWCEEKRGCLTPPALVAPMKGTSHFSGPWVSMKSQNPEVRPILVGRVMTMDSIAPGEFGITLFHGQERYTHYRGLNRLAPGLAAGSLLNPTEILGYATPTDTSGFSARFRGEASGMPMELFASLEGWDHGD